MEFKSSVDRAVENLAYKISGSRSSYPEIKLGYKVNSNPRDAQLLKAQKNGFLAECSSEGEVKRVLKLGFKPHEIILNGSEDYSSLSDRTPVGLRLLFCNSVEEFEKLIPIAGMASGLGFRISLEDLEGLEMTPEMIESIKKIKGKAYLAFQFQLPKVEVGFQKWMESLDSLLLWCQQIETRSGVKVKALVLGGSIFPLNLEELDFQKIQESVRKVLSGIHVLYFETPGI